MTEPQPYRSDPVRNATADNRVLIVEVDGSTCDRLIELVLDRAVTGFVITERIYEWGCTLGMGLTRFVAIILWSPIDAADVTLSQSR